MVTSRLFQHFVILAVLVVMLETDYLNCHNPVSVLSVLDCASPEVKDPARDTAIPLIAVAGCLSIMTFVFYLLSSRYLKVGVIATERNPWLAVRVGDITEALYIFKVSCHAVT